MARCPGCEADLRCHRGDRREAGSEPFRQRRQRRHNAGQASAGVHTRVRLPVSHIIPNSNRDARFIENEIRLNVLGLMNTYIASAKQMVKQGFGGRIIGAGSIASYRTAGEALRTMEGEGVVKS